MKKYKFSKNTDQWNQILLKSKDLPQKRKSAMISFIICADPECKNCCPVKHSRFKSLSVLSWTLIMMKRPGKRNYLGEEPM